MAEVAKTYSHILVARHSPQNKCFAPDGDVLYVRPREHVPMKPHGVVHHFASTTDDSTASQFGWVQRAHPFTLEDFISDHLPDRIIADKQREHLVIMFDSLARLEEGTPVAAYYQRRGVERATMELSVHRVFFHRS